jgi:deoxycytidylate deaminase
MCAAIRRPAPRMTQRRDEARQRQAPLSSLKHPGSELVFGLVCAVGTDSRGIQNALASALRSFRYEPAVLHLSNYLASIVPIQASDEFSRIMALMDAGNAVRAASGSNDIVALASVASLVSIRDAAASGQANSPEPRKAHIFVSLKSPEEVHTLRRIYGPGFFLIGVYSREDRRRKHLTGVKRMSEKQADELIRRDEDEVVAFGQKTRDTFELADVFVDAENHELEINRFLDLVFGNPYVTPTLGEFAMYQACAASLRSGQLGRQVGAAIVSPGGDVLAVGCNDVPKAGGGLYWPGNGDQRDHVLGYDSNEHNRSQIVDEIIQAILPKNAGLARRAEAKAKLRSTRLWDMTEYGRAVHAEMDALMTCARIGQSAVGSALYTTTFPCHNCARHIIAAGIERVVYIEPYPKSRALDLHFDAISVDGRKRRVGRSDRVSFEPFIGIGPRRFLPLFSMGLGEGQRLKRKQDGILTDWKRSDAEPRVPMLPRSYLEQEQIATKMFFDIMSHEER